MCKSQAERGAVGFVARPPGELARASDASGGPPGAHGVRIMLPPHRPHRAHGHGLQHERHERRRWRRSPPTRLAALLCLRLGAPARACVLALFAGALVLYALVAHGSMGNKHDWWTYARQRHSVRVLGAALLRTDDARMAALAALLPPTGFNPARHAWAVTIGTAGYDKRAVRATLASIAGSSAVRKVLVLYSNDIAEVDIRAMLTPELARCLELELMPMDPLACPNADAWHTRRYHGTYMRFHLWGQTRYERIVYVDLDFVVLSPRFDALFYYDMPPGALVGAAPYSDGLCYVGDAPTNLWRPWCPLLAMLDDGLFNAGMMVLTPNALLARGIMATHERAQREAVTLMGERFCVTSQPVLQHFFVWQLARAVDYLPVGFNFWPKAHMPLPTTQLGAHFVGTAKPWHFARAEAEAMGPAHAAWWRLVDLAEGTDGMVACQTPATSGHGA